MAVTLNTTNVTAVLKKVILPYVQNNLPRNSFAYDKMKKDSDMQVMNDNFYAPVRTQRHSGIVNLANDDVNLRSGNSTKAQASIAVKTVTGTFDISDLVIKATKSNKLAVENELTFQARTLAEDMSKDLNRQLFSDGVGIVGQVSGSVGAGTLTIIYPDSSLDDGRSIEWYGTINNDIPSAKYLSTGMAIGIGTAAADVGTISTITYNAAKSVATVVVTGAPAIVANDAIYKVDGSDSAAGTSEIQGFRLALNSGATYAGLTRASQGEVWTPQLSGTAANATFTMSVLEDAYMSAREFGAADDSYYIFMNKSLYRKYGDLLVAMRRTVNTLELTNGWVGLEFAMGGGKRVVVINDYDCPDGEVILVNMDSWKYCQVSEMEFLEQPDGSLIRRLDTLKYQATMVHYCNVICLAPAANARMVRKTAL